MRSLSIVIPAYNEGDNIERTLQVLCALPWEMLTEIVVVNDGSADDTAARVAQAAQSDARIRLVEMPHNQGKGAAVRAGMLAAQGEAILFTDADLVYRMDDIPQWVEALEQYDMINGNRVLEASVLHVPKRLVDYVAKRSRYGVIFNRFVRLIFGIQSTDTQGGLKLFRRELAHRLARTAQENGFAFDVEFFALAHLWGSRTHEAPVQLDYRSDASQVRVFYHGAQMLKALVQIWWRLRGQRAGS